MMNREQIEMWADSSDKAIRLVGQSHLECLNQLDAANAHIESMHAEGQR